MIKTVVAFDWIISGIGRLTAAENIKHFTRFFTLSQQFFLSITFENRGF